MKKDHAANFGRKGWELTIYCMIVYFFTFGSVMSMNVLAVDLNEAKGWSLTAIYSYETIGMILCMVVYYLLGIVNNKGKLNLRIGIGVVGIASAILIALWGVAALMPLGLFICIASITYTITQSWGRVFNDNMVANWFPHKKGEVMGWTTVGIPIGSAMGVLLYYFLLNITGNSSLVYVVFAVVFVILTIWGIVSFRPFPEDQGYYPDNDHSMTREKALEELNEGLELSKNSPWTPGRVLGTWQVWVLALGLCFMEFYSSTVGQMIPNLLDAGLEEGTAETMMTIACLSAGAFSILWGFVDRKIGARNAVIVVLAIAVFGSICRFTGSVVGCWISIFCVGALMGGGPNFTVSIVSSYWGRYNFAKVFGTVLALATFFAALGPTVLSAVAEATNYATGYLVLGICCACGIVFMLITNGKFVAKREEQFAAKDNK